VILEHVDISSDVISIKHHVGYILPDVADYIDIRIPVLIVYTTYSSLTSNVFFLTDFNNLDSLGECNSAFQRTQDNINVNEISESLTSASSAPAGRTEVFCQFWKKKEVLSLLVIKT
jgi:hypothetical protein